MNTRILIVVLGVVLIASALWALAPKRAVAPREDSPVVSEASSTTPAQVATSTSHEAVPTPQKAATGTLRGHVTLGPTCPVERDPPDPACAPKPYQTSVQILSDATGKAITVRTDANGSFSTTLVSGNYHVTPQGGAVLPRCASADAHVQSGQTQNVELSCDTGIR